MEGKNENMPHKLTFENRTSGTITGVRDVTSFDEKEIILLTTQGKLIKRGTDACEKAGSETGRSGSGRKAGGSGIPVRKQSEKRRTVIKKDVSLICGKLYPL